MDSDCDAGPEFGSWLGCLVHVMFYVGSFYGLRWYMLWFMLVIHGVILVFLV